MAGTSTGQSARTAMRRSRPAFSGPSRRSALQRSSSASSRESWGPAAFFASSSGVSLSSSESASVPPSSCRKPRSTHQSGSWARTRRETMATKAPSSTLAAPGPAQRSTRSSARRTEKSGCNFSRRSLATAARSRRSSASMLCTKRPATFFAWRPESPATASSLPRPRNSASLSSPSWPSVIARPKTPAQTRASASLSAGTAAGRSPGCPSPSSGAAA
mmetsp:Transcript_39316/g.94187  ORF Transcript_39316/g.94187 Transcript_39316/m.94187 type:complete len:218 (+) Transcript_39316:160-813(+)